jgi:Flp pilus assembly pilin Flp
MKRTIARLGYLLATRDERGTSAVEYGLILAAFALFCFGVVEGLGHVLQAVFAHQDAINQGPVPAP